LLFLPPWIWACALAPFIGSFLGVVVTRYDAPGSAIAGRSACDTCGVTLGARDLVPFLSWVLSRGRCRHCGADVGWFYPAIEFCAVIVAIWSALVFSGPAFWISCGLGWVLVALAAADFKYLLLPDFLTLPLIAGGLAANWVLEPASLTAHGIGAGAGFGTIVVLRFVYERLKGREGMGLGDAKLFAAAGAWNSWPGLPSVLVIAAVTALIFAFLRRARGGPL
jgi:leader peptidase (prepilin peptidase)/N-methyltransferase